MPRVKARKLHASAEAVWVELEPDVSLLEAEAAIVKATSSSPSSFISLDKQAPAHQDKSVRAFSILRPGDRLWVVPSPLAPAEAHASSGGAIAQRPMTHGAACPQHLNTADSQGMTASCFPGDTDCQMSTSASAGGAERPEGVVGGRPEQSQPRHTCAEFGGTLSSSASQPAGTPCPSALSDQQGAGVGNIARRIWQWAPDLNLAPAVPQPVQHAGYQHWTMWLRGHQDISVHQLAFPLADHMVLRTFVQATRAPMQSFGMVIALPDGELLAPSPGSDSKSLKTVAEGQAIKVTGTDLKLFLSGLSEYCKCLATGLPPEARAQAPQATPPPQGANRATQGELAHDFDRSIEAAMAAAGFLPCPDLFSGHESGYHVQHFRHTSLSQTPVRTLTFTLANKVVTYSELRVGDKLRQRQTLVPRPQCSAGAEAARAGLDATAHERVAMWALNTLCALHEQPLPWGLAALPEACVQQVLLGVAAEDLCACARVCRGLHAASDADALWRARLKEDFGRAYCDEGITPKQQYKQLAQARAGQQRAQRDHERARQRRWRGQAPQQFFNFRSPTEALRPAWGPRVLGGQRSGAAYAAAGAPALRRLNAAGQEYAWM